MKTEDDHAFVTIDGKLTEIEMSQVGMSSFSNKLFQTVRGMDNKIYTRSTTDSIAWSGWSESGGGYTSSAIATSTFGNKLFQAVRGEDNSIYTRSTADGTKWTTWTKTDDLGKTPSAVSMSIFGNKLFQAVRGTDNNIYTRSTADGKTWTTWAKTDDLGKTPSAVSMSTFGNKLFQTVQGMDNSIYTRSTADGKTWTTWKKNDDLGKTLTEAEDITDNLPTEQYRWQAVYYNNNSLSGAPVFGGVEGNATGFSNSWGSGGPGSGVGNDNFSARYTGAFKFESAQYTFKPNADDGFRIWIDGKLYHDAWNAPSQKTFQLGMSAGIHSIKVEYRELTGNAQAQFSWEKFVAPPKIVAPPGLMSTTTKLAELTSGKLIGTTIDADKNGTTQCWDLVGYATDNPSSTTTWKSGANVITNGNVAIGTAIATFLGPNGTYDTPPKYTNQHTAIFAGYGIENGVTGFWVWDQNWGGSFAIKNHFISTNGASNSTSDADNYFVVQA